MNWGEWYPSAHTHFISNSQLTFAEALTDLVSKNKILPETMIYFIDSKHMDTFKKSAEKLKRSIVEEISKNDYDDEIGFLLNPIALKLKNTRFVKNGDKCS